MRVQFMSDVPSQYPLPIFDPVPFLTTTTSPLQFQPPNANLFQSNDNNQPHQIHQYTFVTHQKNQQKPLGKHHSTRRPKPPKIILQSMHTQQSNPNKLFAPDKLYLSPPPNNNQNLPYRKPSTQFDTNADTWDIKFNISNELRELLKLEKEKLQSLAYAINSKPKWPVTKSRSMHRDEDVFVGRANNPFGHSTKWKLR